MARDKNVSAELWRRSPRTDVVTAATITSHIACSSIRRQLCTDSLRLALEGVWCLLALWTGYCAVPTGAQNRVQASRVQAFISCVHHTTNLYLKVIVPPTLKYEGAQRALLWPFVFQKSAPLLVAELVINREILGKFFNSMAGTGEGPKL